MWIYLSEKRWASGIVLYDYRPGRGGETRSNSCPDSKGCCTVTVIPHMGRIEDVVLVCCLAHCRRKFYEAVPTGRRKS